MVITNQILFWFPEDEADVFLELPRVENLFRSSLIKVFGSFWLCRPLFIQRMPERLPVFSVDLVMKSDRATYVTLTAMNYHWEYVHVCYWLLQCPVLSSKKQLNELRNLRTVGIFSHSLLSLKQSAYDKSVFGAVMVSPRKNARRLEKFYSRDYYFSNLHILGVCSKMRLLCLQ